MEVKIIAITKSLIKEKELSAEELLVYEARLSNPSNQLNSETSDKLIAYMIKNNHWSPFDMINMTVGVTTSRAIAHQILRHWSIKPQEFSQRYAEATSYEPINLRLAHQNNRQSSTEEICTINIESRHISFNSSKNNKRLIEFKDYSLRVLNNLVEADKLYKEGIERGLAKECVRMILPLTTSTTIYLNGSVRSWIHYMNQRCDEHAQLEHRIVAEEVKKIFNENFPMTATALNNLKTMESIK